eukprot:3547324-Prymnesium_polylepis.1
MRQKVTNSKELSSPSMVSSGYLGVNLGCRVHARGVYRSQATPLDAAPRLESRLTPSPRNTHEVQCVAGYYSDLKAPDASVRRGSAPLSNSGKMSGGWWRGGGGGSSAVSRLGDSAAPRPARSGDFSHKFARLLDGRVT